ncbi:MAG: hypothetical protein KJ065_23640 [Anaerolineae bacterium]|nr:hypothetical protein [Anaerolineae bacterium]
MNKDTLFEERSYEQIMENLGSPQSLTPTRLELIRRSLPEIVEWLLLTSGLKTHGRKVNRDQVIRKRHAAGERLSKLAREFGVSPQRVHQIVKGGEF